MPPNETSVLSEILSKSFNNDLLKAILSPNIDTFSDIKYRLSAFKSLKDLIIYDQNKKPIFQYKNSKLNELKTKMIKEKILFTDNNLFVKEDIVADNYTFGFTLINLDLSEYLAQQKKDMFTILLIFPLALILGLIVSISS